MISLTLNRDYFTSYCILGRLADPQSGRSWDTIERPWVPTSLGVCGVKGLSCIGLGTYRVSRYSSDAHPSVYAISNPGLDVCVTEQEVAPTKHHITRTRVLIHPANWASELRGCIAPGKSRARGPGGIWMVERSRDAMNEIRNLLSKSAELTLSISSGGIAP
ncbi:MAG: hypothetical protein RL254_1232 [Planctomycetota bacterium]|jgi:hypothetical protein